MSDTVLVTGGFGLVGSATVLQLAADNRRVVIADLETPGNVKKAQALPGRVEVRWTDLTDPDQVQRLVSEVAPAAIIHLAAIIPPLIYRNARLARRVNVEATATVVRVAETQPGPPRFVQASSNAVFGARNPHRHTEILRADDPMRPCDLYSATKAEAEQIVRSSSLEWVVLRFGAVLSTDLLSMPFNTDALFFESVLPTDGRMHSVDVRDVAAACAAATTADVAGEILLIAGDDVTPSAPGRSRASAFRGAGDPGCAARGSAGRSRERHRLVRHRLDGHQPRAGSAEIPASLMARHGRRDEGAGRVETLSGSLDRSARPGVPQAPLGVLEGAGQVRRSVGRDPREVGRTRARQALRPRVTA